MSVVSGECYYQLCQGKLDRSWCTALPISNKREIAAGPDSQHTSASRGPAQVVQKPKKSSMRPFTVLYAHTTCPEKPLYKKMSKPFLARGNPSALSVCLNKKLFPKSVSICCKELTCSSGFSVLIVPRCENHVPTQLVQGDLSF